MTTSSAQAQATERARASQREQFIYQVSKLFARKSGVLVTSGSLESFADLILAQLLEAGGDAAVEAAIKRFREENGNYQNKHFPT